MEESTSAASVISEAPAVCAFSSTGEAASNQKCVGMSVPTKMGACRSCGGMHSRTTCKFRDAKCYKCHRNEHIAKVCISVSKVNKLELEVNYIAGANSFLRQFNIFGTAITFLIDTGSPVSIIPSYIMHSVGGQLLGTKEYKQSLKCYSGNVIRTIGGCELTLEDPTMGLRVEGPLELYLLCSKASVFLVVTILIC